MPERTGPPDIPADLLPLGSIASGGFDRLREFAEALDRDECVMGDHKWDHVTDVTPGNEREWWHCFACGQSRDQKPE